MLDRKHLLRRCIVGMDEPSCALSAQIEWKSVPEDALPSLELNPKVCTSSACKIKVSLTWGLTLLLALPLKKSNKN